MPEPTSIDQIAPPHPDRRVPPTASEAWAEAMWLPCTLSVDLHVPKFTIGNLLNLEEDSIIDSQWNQNADVPLRINGLLMGYAEFEVVGEKAGVRLTELL